MEYGVCLVLCSSKEGGRKKKLRAQRCEMGEERRLYAGWSLRLGGPSWRQKPGDMRHVQQMDGWGHRPSSVFPGQQIFTKSKGPSNSDTMDNLPQVVHRKVPEKMRYMHNTDLHIERENDVGDTNQLLQPHPYEDTGLSYYWLYLFL